MNLEILLHTLITVAFVVFVISKIREKKDNISYINIRLAMVIIMTIATCGLFIIDLVYGKNYFNNLFITLFGVFTIRRIYITTK